MSCNINSQSVRLGLQSIACSTYRKMCILCVYPNSNMTINKEYEHAHLLATVLPRVSQYFGLSVGCELTGTPGTSSLADTASNSNNYGFFLRNTPPSKHPYPRDITTGTCIKEFLRVHVQFLDLCTIIATFARMLSALIEQFGHGNCQE